MLLQGLRISSAALTSIALKQQETRRMKTPGVLHSGQPAGGPVCPVRRLTQELKMIEEELEKCCRL